MPIPSNTYFPASLAARVAWLLNFLANLTPIAPMLGITNAELADLALDVEDFQSVAATTVSADSFRSSLREFRLSFSEGKVGDPTPVFPAENFNAPPNAPRPAGFFQRLIELIDRIRAAPAYTNEIGAALGILPAQSNGIPEADVKPSIEVFPSQTNYMFSVVASDRGEADAFVVKVQPKGGNWSDAGMFTGKSADVTYAPATPGEPVMISVRVKLRRKNADYGQMSDVVPVTLNP
jgi:hypothetical protein